MTTVQKWLAGMIGLGALYLIVSNPNGTYKAAQSISTIVGGTENQIIRGK